jgi:hypothetical protein
MAHFCYNFIEFNAKPYVQPKGWYQCYEIVIFVIVLTNEKTSVLRGKQCGYVKKIINKNFLQLTSPGL